MKLIKNLKWIVGASTLLAMLAVVPVVHGGGRWSGIDPELQYGGHKVNIWVEWHSEDTCAINGPIKMRVDAPGASLVADSIGTFACEDGTTATLQTQTSVQDSVLLKNGHLKVKDATVLAPGRIPVSLVIYVDGALKAECKGHSNEPFDCGAGQVIKHKEG